MKRFVLVKMAFCLAFVPGFAQEVGEYGFLTLPVSSHTAALGGTAISVVEPEAALADQNAALLCPQMDGQISASYMNYVSDINLGYASYTRQFRSAGAWQAGIRFVNYGDFAGYDEEGNATGTFGAKDIAIQGGLGFPVSSRWRMGVSTRAIYSKYECESAFAIGVDVGLNYYDEASGRSISMVLSNLGGPLKQMEGHHCHLPTQLTVGITKEVEHLPFCFTLTGLDLFDWDQNYVNAQGEVHRYKGGEQLLNHLLFGVEWVPTDNFYVASAYSLRRQREFSGSGGFLRGLSVGAGLNWQQWRFQVGYASYNAADGSLVFGLEYKF